MYNLESLRGYISRRYSIVDIVEALVTDQFNITQDSERTVIITPCPFSGEGSLLFVKKKTDGSETFYRSNSNYIDEAYANVPTEGMALDLLSGLYPKDSTAQLIGKLRDYEVPKKF